MSGAGIHHIEEKGNSYPFVAIIDGKKKDAGRITSFIYPDDGPIPPIVAPEKPDEAKDGGVQPKGKKLDINPIRKPN